MPAAVFVEAPFGASAVPVMGDWTCCKTVPGAMPADAPAIAGLAENAVVAAQMQASKSAFICR